MLRNAPKFYEVAKRIIEITKDCIVVAHNAQFDYRVLRTEFSRLGFDYERNTLCTVELSKKLIPDQDKYSLGKLVRSLGIPISDRHRANGDAMATVKLFKLLLSKDAKKTIITNSVKTEVKRKLAPKLLDIVEELPSITGVYYMHKEGGDIVYIGKSKNIKKRVLQHFTASTRKAKNIQREVIAVTYEDTGSELIALLKESEEIKTNKPIYNRAQRRSIFQFALYETKTEEGYISFEINKTDFRKKAITSFASMKEGKRFLETISEKYQLCQGVNGLYNASPHCFQYRIKECAGACNSEENIDVYNKRAQKFIEDHSYKNNNLIIVDRGRQHDERSAILIENGVYKGFGFFDLNHQITNLDILRKLITPMQNNRDVQHIIQSYLRRKRVMKVIEI